MTETIVAFGLMVIELLAAEFVFGRFLERKPYFYLRFFGSALVCLVTAFWIEIIYSLLTGTEFTYEGVSGWQDSLFKFIYYVVVFVMTIAAVRYSYRGSMWAVLLYCSGGYAMQHIAKNLCSLIGVTVIVCGLPPVNIWLSFLIEIAVCALLYTAIYFLFIRRRNPPDLKKDIRGKVLLFLAVIFICIVISRFTTDNPDRDVLAQVAESVAAIVNCVFILSNLFDMTDRDKAQSDMQIMKELLRREKEQYKLTKENIDLINIKCHDLKHQIQALRQNASEPYIKKIEDAVMFYDSVAKTGNDVLDVILTEKTLLFEQNRITFTCMARGEDLSFMDDMDIYSLFGNALSNAFERVKLIEDESRRCISVNVNDSDCVLFIHIENFYDGQVHFEDGLPATDKDRNYHGFGMKSMDYIAHRYNGCMTVSAEDGIFSLDFVFPLPVKGEKEGAEKVEAAT